MHYTRHTQSPRLTTELLAPANAICSCRFPNHTRILMMMVLVSHSCFHFDFHYFCKRLQQQQVYIHNTTKLPIQKWRYSFARFISLSRPLLRSHVNDVFMQFSCGNYKMIFGFISLEILCCDWLHCTRITFLFVFTVNGGKCTFAIVFESRQSRWRHRLFFISFPSSFDQNTTSRRTFTLWNSRYNETTWISL